MLYTFYLEVEEKHGLLGSFSGADFFLFLFVVLS